EGVVVEVESAGIEEQDLAHFGALLQLGRMVVGDAGGVGRPLHHGGEILEDLGRGEAVRLQDQLALDVLDRIEAPPVGVGALIAFVQPLPELAALLFAVHCCLPVSSLSHTHPTAVRYCVDLAERFHLPVIVADIVAVVDAPRYAAPEVLQERVVGTLLAGRIGRGLRLADGLRDLLWRHSGLDAVHVAGGRGAGRRQPDDGKRHGNALHAPLLPPLCTSASDKSGSVWPPTIVVEFTGWRTAARCATSLPCRCFPVFSRPACPPR